MRVMALHAIHLLLRHRVVLGKLKLHLFLAMALETGRWVLPGINDEFASPAAAGNVQACRPVARFAACLAHRTRVFQVDSSMGASRKDAGDAAMAIGAGLVADERRAGNDRWRRYYARSGGTRIHQQGNAPGYTKGKCSSNDPPPFHSRLCLHHSPYWVIEQTQSSMARVRRYLTGAARRAQQQP